MAIVPRTTRVPTMIRGVILSTPFRNSLIATTTYNGILATIENSEIETSMFDRLLKNPDPRLFKKVQMRGAREIDERRRIY